MPSKYEESTEERNYRKAAETARRREAERARAAAEKRDRKRRQWPRSR